MRRIVDANIGHERTVVAKFREKTQGVWEWTLSKPLTKWVHGKLTITVADKQGNVTKIERSLSMR